MAQGSERLCAKAFPDGWPLTSWASEDTRFDGARRADARIQGGTSTMKSVLLAVAIAAMRYVSLAANTTAKLSRVLLGTTETGVTVYRGVPTAAPPVGGLRWRSPQPAAKWGGVRPADKFAPQCVQGIQSIATSEDCLQRLDACEVGLFPGSGAGVDLRRRLWSGRHFGSDLQRRGSREKGNNAGIWRTVLCNCQFGGYTALQCGSACAVRRRGCMLLRPEYEFSGDT